MGAFFAIVKLTCRAAIRSHIFQLLLLILVLSIVVIPITIAGDGTASGYIQVSLKYSLGFVGFILSMSTVWLGCVSMSADVESGQLHMVVSKPVSRITVWIGKCAGVTLINAFLLLFAGLAIYFMVLWQFSRQNFKPEEKKRMENEVMVGRRVFYPILPDIDAIAREEYKNRLAAVSSEDKSGVKAPPLDENMKKMAFLEIKKRVLSGLAEVKAGEQKAWSYKGLPVDSKQAVYLRYRTYIGKISSQDQRFTAGVWAARMTVPVEAEPSSNTGAAPAPKDGKKPVEMRTFYVAKSLFPDQIMCGIFNELELNPAAVDKNGAAEILFTNYDPQRQTLYFQISDGPKMLVRVAGFFQNYMRGIAVMLLRLVTLAAVSCAFGAFLSTPVAVFFVCSYLFFGSMATFVAAGDAGQLGMVSGDVLAWHVSKLLLLVVIPMQKFEVSQLIASGELVEFGRMASLFLSYFVFKALPVVLFGMWMYRRREMGLVVKR